MWQLGPRRTCTAQRMCCVYIVLVCVMFIVCTLLCVLVHVSCLALCAVCLGVGVVFALCFRRTADYRPCVFLRIEYRYNDAHQGGGVFREKIFFKERKRFCLGIIVLKFIFDFGLRVKKITELQSAIP